MHLCLSTNVLGLRFSTQDGLVYPVPFFLTSTGSKGCYLGGLNFNDYPSLILAAPGVNIL